MAHLLMENVYMHWWCGGSVIFSCDGGGGVCVRVCVCM